MTRDNEFVSPAVLVVDDERDVRKVISAWLQLAGYTVLEAPSGSDAIRLYTTRPDISLLVTDIRMPEMDGLTLAERLIELAPNLRIIYMTGYCEAGPNALPGSVWMRKPFGMEEFLKHVRELLATEHSSRVGSR